MSVPVKKNDDITLEITGMTDEGSGVGRYEGFAVFVPYAMVGETVSVHIIKVTSSYAVGKLSSVLVSSENRVTPPCPVFRKCGGCALQHMSYKAQLDFKRQKVKDALERIGGFAGIEVKPVLGMDEPLRYRNKGSFPFASINGSPRWGLYAERTHRLIETDDCVIESEESVSAANAVRAWASENNVSVYDEETGKGLLRHVVTRTMTGGTAVVVVTTGKLPNEKALVSHIISSVKNTVSIYHNINNKNTNVICGDKYRLIWGEQNVIHNILGLDFEVSPESFLQVNTHQTEKLYDIAVEGLELNGSETCADIFCGIGTISLLLAKKSASVVGVEYVERAVEDAKRNALRNGISNAEFYSGAAEEVLPRLIEQGSRFDKAVLDPPRKGADAAVLRAVIASGAERIAYVSCNPATLARDLKILSSAYKIDSVQPVDMFAMSGHVETVVLLSKQKIDR